METKEEQTDDLTEQEKVYYAKRLLTAREIMRIAKVVEGNAADVPEVLVAVYEKITTPLHYKRQEQAKLEAREKYSKESK